MISAECELECSQDAFFTLVSVAEKRENVSTVSKSDYLVNEV